MLSPGDSLLGVGVRHFGGNGPILRFSEFESEGRSGVARSWLRAFHCSTLILYISICVANTKPRQSHVHINLLRKFKKTLIEAFAVQLVKSYNICFLHTPILPWPCALSFNNCYT